MNKAPRPHPGVALIVAMIFSLVALNEARAWGPHSEITRAACAAVPASDHLDERLNGADALAEYCWMADYREHAFPNYYADDYLIFPSFPKHVDHLPPAVLATFTPYFRRALQALRTESPTNAARWVGSLLHFQEDTGAPPHAAEIRGDLHTKLENWLDAKAIQLGNAKHPSHYQPQLLGDGEESAIAGFQQRMKGLILFSKQRAARARPFCEANNREAAEPIILESALETARVAADLIHTLLVVSNLRTRPTAGATLVVRVSAPSLPALRRSPARMLLLGTDYSTIAEPVQSDERGYIGECVLRELPTGSYRVLVYRTGARAKSLPMVRLRAGEQRQFEVMLDPDLIPGNLVRDAERKIHYSSPDTLEHWQRIGAGAGAAWRTAATPVEAGATYRIGALLKKNADTVVRVRWDHFVTEAALRSDVLAGNDDKFEAELVAPERSLNVRLLIFTNKPLDEVLIHPWVVKEAPGPREFNARYLRADGTLEAEIARARNGDGLRMTSVTQRSQLKLTLTTELTAREELKSATVLTESANNRLEARAEYRDGRLVVRRANGEEQVFDSTPKLIVTSAPDWTDTVLLCQRYDRERRGVQRFPALWFHPTDAAQLATFSAERMNSATLEHNGLRLPLDKLILVIRNGSRYLAWATPDGQMIKLTPMNRSGTLQQEASLYLQGYEKSARELE